MATEIMLERIQTLGPRVRAVRKQKVRWILKGDEIGTLKDHRAVCFLNRKKEENHLTIWGGVRQGFS